MVEKMTSVEVEVQEEALRILRVELVKRLDPTDNVLDFLYKNNGLTEVMYERILAAENRLEQCRVLLDAVRQKMIVPLFVDALEHKGSHVKLAAMLMDTIYKVNHSGWTSKTTRTEIGKKGIKPNMYTQPHRLQIVDSKGTELANIGFELRRISHKGIKYLYQFDAIVVEMKGKYSHDPDVVFKMLESELIKGRLFLENGSEQWSKLKEMETLVATLTHSEAGSMIFLARKAAIVSMEGDLLNVMKALDIVEEARKKMGFIQPCADTARVMFVYVNILIQLYEHIPSRKRREMLIDSIREAIVEHFPQCPQDIRDEFCRIFYQKLACCYLGVGVYGRLFNAGVTEDDVKSAEDCLERIESGGVFDDRRIMLYNLAKAAVFYYKELHCPQRTGEFSSQALKHANIARRLSDKNSFGKELCEIEAVFRHIYSITPQTSPKPESASIQPENLVSCNALMPNTDDHDNTMDASYDDVREEEDMETWESHCNSEMLG
ncbi:uncharacterized protein [Haliotis cracherodii]|uniref:uncharacterized protein n=1 Tax=Haliotis cracherodii TaxID=6455 RepID=UPI0039E7844A